MQTLFDKYYYCENVIQCHLFCLRRFVINTVCVHEAIRKYFDIFYCEKLDTTNTEQVLSTFHVKIKNQQ